MSKSRVIHYKRYVVRHCCYSPNDQRMEDSELLSMSASDIDAHPNPVFHNLYILPDHYSKAISTYQAMLDIVCDEWDISDMSEVADNECLNVTESSWCLYFPILRVHLPTSLPIPPKWDLVTKLNDIQY